MHLTVLPGSAEGKGIHVAIEGGGGDRRLPDCADASPRASGSAGSCRPPGELRWHHHTSTSSTSSHPTHPRTSNINSHRRTTGCWVPLLAPAMCPGRF